MHANITYQNSLILAFLILISSITFQLHIIIVSKLKNIACKICKIKLLPKKKRVDKLKNYLKIYVFNILIP